MWSEYIIDSPRHPIYRSRPLPTCPICNTKMVPQPMRPVMYREVCEGVRYVEYRRVDCQNQHMFVYVTWRDKKGNLLYSIRTDREAETMHYDNKDTFYNHGGLRWYFRKKLSKRAGIQVKFLTLAGRISLKTKLYD